MLGPDPLGPGTPSGPGPPLPGPGPLTSHPPPWDQAHPLPQDQGHPPLVNRITDNCKNITLPQTSFAGRNNRFLPELKGSEIRHWSRPYHVLPNLPIMLLLLMLTTVVQLFY